MRANFYITAGMFILALVAVVSNNVSARRRYSKKKQHSKYLIPMTAFRD